MKKFLPVVSIVLALVLLFSFGCAPAVPKEDFDKAKSDLAAAKTDISTTQNQLKALQTQIGKLSAIQAYWIWVDQYNNYWYYGPYYYLYTTYQFADKTAFFNNFGTLIKATNDSDTLKTWDNYTTYSKSLDDVVKSLPEDYKTWNKDQTAKWTQANTDSWTAFYYIGIPLYAYIVKK